MVKADVLKNACDGESHFFFKMKEKYNAFILNIAYLIHCEN